VGADNDDVLGELGLSAEEIAELRETMSIDTQTKDG
jgi:crotonobetainyl-CoA:carnitine CoA-transferase CaiB-like acyl-CoA transferase